MIWSDAIQSYRKHHPTKTDWKVILFIYITWIHAINWWIIMIWLKYFNILTIPLIIIDVFPGQMLNSFLGFAIEFALPLGVVNYLLVFYKNRYNKIIIKYNNIKIRYAPIYSIIVACVALFSAFLYGILS